MHSVSQTPILMLTSDGLTSTKDLWVKMNGGSRITPSGLPVTNTSPPHMSRRRLRPAESNLELGPLGTREQPPLVPTPTNPTISPTILQEIMLRWKHVGKCYGKFMILRLELEACMGSTFLGLLGGAGIFTETIPIQPYGTWRPPSMLRSITKYDSLSNSTYCLIILHYTYNSYRKYRAIIQ